MVSKQARLPLQTSEDIVRARQAVREWSVAAGFNIVGQTKMVTAASELARNTVDYGGGGEMILEALNGVPRRGLRLTFVDSGPGIADVALALKDGWTSGKGLGLGLSGARRLCDEFSIDTKAGEGTRIMVARWS